MAVEIGKTKRNESGVTKTKSPETAAEGNKT